MTRRKLNWDIIKNEGKLTCSCCEQELPLSTFQPKGDFHYTTCIQCQEKNRLEKLTNIDGKISYIYKKSRRRSIEKNYDFDLTVKYLKDLYAKQNGLCYLSGLRLEVSGTNAISLDRLDSSKGYIQGNVLFCCLSINKIKSDLSIDDFIKYCSYVAEHNRDRLK
jgi:hypothetical protein